MKPHINKLEEKESILKEIYEVEKFTCEYYWPLYLESKETSHLTPSFPAILLETIENRGRYVEHLRRRLLEQREGKCTLCQNSKGSCCTKCGNGMPRKLEVRSVGTTGGVSDNFGPIVRSEEVTRSSIGGKEEWIIGVNKPESSNWDEDKGVVAWNEDLLDTPSKEKLVNTTDEFMQESIIPYVVNISATKPPESPSWMEEFDEKFRFRDSLEYTPKHTIKAFISQLIEREKQKWNRLCVSGAGGGEYEKLIQETLKAIYEHRTAESTDGETIYVSFKKSNFEEILRNRLTDK